MTATRLLHDQIESSIRSSVSSGVGAATWIIFVPFALVFGVATDRLGIYAGGRLLAAAAASTTGLRVAVTGQCAPQAGLPSPAPRTTASMPRRRSSCLRHEAGTITA